MAIKTKVTNKSAPKEAIVTIAAPTAENISAVNLNKTVDTLHKTATAETQINETSASKENLQPQAAASEPAEKGTPNSIENMSDKTLPIETTHDEQPAPQSHAALASGQKWQEIRFILEKLKEDTLREIKKSVKNGTEAVAVIEPGGDIYDQASSERDRELGLLLGDREREKIHSIDEALLRITEGDYGICEECDEDIPLGRLKAMPFTRHCVKCKSDLEKLQAQTKRVEEERAYREIPLGADEEDS